MSCVDIKTEGLVPLFVEDSREESVFRHKRHLDMLSIMYICISDLHVISCHSLSYLLISVREIDASPPDSGGEFSTTQVISRI